jgi:hypothetical protein
MPAYGFGMYSLKDSGPGLYFNGSISGSPGHLDRPHTLWPRDGISLHRSEGFGQGVDVIATAYGGNTDFLTGLLAHQAHG